MVFVGDLPIATRGKSSSEHPYRRTANECESAVAWLLVVLSLSFPRHRQIERKKKKTRDFIINISASSLVSMGMRPVDWDIGLFALAIKLLYSRTAKRGDLDSLNTHLRASHPRACEVLAENFYYFYISQQNQRLTNLNMPETSCTEEGAILSCLIPELRLILDL